MTLVVTDQPFKGDANIYSRVDHDNTKSNIGKGLESNGSMNASQVIQAVPIPDSNLTRVKNGRKAEVMKVAKSFKGNNQCGSNCECDEGTQWNVSSEDSHSNNSDESPSIIDADII